MALQDDCTGEFWGWGTVCNPNPCPQPTGACCFMRLCFELTEDDCVNNWGTYMGDGTPCEPNPCISDVTTNDAASRLFLIVSPNPAVDVVTIGYGLPVAGLAHLDLFDTSGRRVRQIREGTENAGGHVVSWDGRDDAGRQVPSGIYFVRLVSEAGVVTKPVLLAR